MKDLRLETIRIRYVRTLGRMETDNEIITNQKSYLLPDEYVIAVNVLLLLLNKVYIPQHFLIGHIRTCFSTVLIIGGENSYCEQKNVLKMFWNLSIPVLEF